MNERSRLRILYGNLAEEIYTFKPSWFNFLSCESAVKTNQELIFTKFPLGGAFNQSNFGSNLQANQEP